MRPVLLMLLLAGCTVTDQDGDGFGVDVDCDDDDPTVHPARRELCNGLDDDCDGLVDTEDDNLDDAPNTQVWYRDLDADGYGVQTDALESCTAPRGYAERDGDCDDREALLNPAATEACNGIDDDCDGLVDHLDPSLDQATRLAWSADADADGFGDPDATTLACVAPVGSVDNAMDCDDTRSDIHPHATELCDGVRNDCDDSSWSADAFIATLEPLHGGEVVDLTARLMTTQPYNLRDGTLTLCAGTWLAPLTLDGTSIVQGIGGSGAVTIHGETSRRIIDHRSGDAIVRGVTLLGGDTPDDGGGIRSDSPTSTLVLEHVILESNGAQGHGAGVYSLAASLTATDVLFRGNTLTEAASSGGGLYLSGGTHTLTRVTFENNLADAGAGLSATHATVTCTDCVFTQNVAASIGGGLGVSDDAHLTLVDPTFIDNSTPGDGGGLHALDSTTLIDGGLFERNEAGGFGGGLALVAGETTLLGTEVRSNTVLEVAGAGLYAQDAEVLLQGAQFLHHDSGSAPGGALRQEGGELTCEAHPTTGVRGLFDENTDWAIFSQLGDPAARLDLTGCDLLHNTPEDLRVDDNVYDLPAGTEAACADGACVLSP